MTDDIIEQAQEEATRVAEEVEHHTGIDRREFVLMSIAAAATATIGVKGASGQGVPSGPGPQQTPPPMAPLGNAEPPAEQFMPYPGGTGALMEKLVRERGGKAFDRTPFHNEAWSGETPKSDEDIAFLPAHRLSALIKARKITSVKATNIYLDRLKKLNPKLLCAVTIMERQALFEAERMDAELASGRYRGPLHGVPYGIKDLFATKGVPTTWGSQDFENRIIDDDAEVVVRLRNAGAVLIAKLSTGLYAQNDQWFRGRTNDPWDLRLGSSGSSAGPASATAAACVAFAIGTETSGSIVSPSRQCGVSALRPTFGRVSRTGGMVLSWTQDRVGPICRTVEDCAMVFEAIHGVDPRDPSTVTMPFHFDSSIKLEALRIGVDSGTTGENARAGAPPEFIAKLRELGMRPREIGARPPASVMGPAGTGGLNSEYAAAFDEIVQRKARETGLDLNALPVDNNVNGRGGGGGAGGGRGGGGGGGAGAVPTTPIPGSSTPNNPAAGPADWNPRFVTGRTIRSMDFINQQRRRYILINQWADFMKDLDMFIASPAVDVGVNAQTGHPCAVVQYKFDSPQLGGGGRGGNQPPVEYNKQPICATIIGNLYNDDLILSVAHRYQAVTDFHTRRPTLA